MFRVKLLSKKLGYVMVVTEEKLTIDEEISLSHLELWVPHFLKNKYNQFMWYVFLC